ncbi:MAG: hypothetical protein WKF77_19545 [Planctomycetaceae bacterium]
MQLLQESTSRGAVRGAVVFGRSTWFSEVLLPALFWREGQTLWLAVGRFASNPLVVQFAAWSLISRGIIASANSKVLLATFSMGTLNPN